MRNKRAHLEGVRRPAGWRAGPMRWALILIFLAWLSFPALSDKDGDMVTATPRCPDCEQQLAALEELEKQKRNKQYELGPASQREQDPLREMMRMDRLRNEIRNLDEQIEGMHRRLADCNKRCAPQPGGGIGIVPGGGQSGGLPPAGTGASPGTGTRVVPGPAPGTGSVLDQIDEPAGKSRADGGRDPAQPPARVPVTPRCPDCDQHRAALDQLEKQKRAKQGEIAAARSRVGDLIERYSGPGTLAEGMIPLVVLDAMREFSDRTHELRNIDAQIDSMRGQLEDCNKRCAPRPGGGVGIVPGGGQSGAPPTAGGAPPTTGAGSAPGAGSVLDQIDEPTGRSGTTPQCRACPHLEEWLRDLEEQKAARQEEKERASARGRKISDKTLSGQPLTPDDQDTLSQVLREIEFQDFWIGNLDAQIDDMHRNIEDCKKKCVAQPGASREVIPGGGQSGPLRPGTIRIVIESVKNVIGNNPFDPQRPIGVIGQVTGTPTQPGACTTPQPPTASQQLPCPAGQSGQITQTQASSCIGSAWVRGPWQTTSNSCTAVTAPPPQGCTAPQPAGESQTLACPSGQTGSIVQTRAYACQGTSWVASTWQTTSNTCTTPPPPPPPPAVGCTTNFSSGTYSCSGSCGVGSAALSVASGSASMTANIGSNSSAVFSCGGATATSQSTNLIILGAPGHRCSLTATGSTAFSLRCQNETGGSCTSSCTR